MNDIGSGHFAEDKEFDLKLLFKVLWKYKFFLILSTSLFASYSVYYSLSLPNIYTSEAVLTPAEQVGQNSGANLGSQYSSLGKLVGVNLSSSSSTSSDHAIEKIKSRSFLKHLISKYNFIAPGLIAVDSYDEDTKSIKYNDNIYDVENNKWVRDFPSYRSLTPSYIELHDIYSSTINVKKNLETGFVSLSAKHQSPVFAQKLVSSIIYEINEISKEKDLNDSKMSLDYLEKKLAETNESAIKSQINILILNNLNTLMTSEIQKNYVLDVLDPPHIPEIRTSPSRAMICIGITLAGLFFSILLIIIYHFNFLSHTSSAQNRTD
jgi:uncharacterized protein involved in exopolysaccharide biosynthesis